MSTRPRKPARRARPSTRQACPAPFSSSPGRAGYDLPVMAHGNDPSLPHEVAAFAAGDCVITHHRLLGTSYLPLGTTAHKQGRIAGENALGGSHEFAGSLGTVASSSRALSAALIPAPLPPIATSRIGVSRYLPRGEPELNGSADSRRSRARFIAHAGVLQDIAGVLGQAFAGALVRQGDDVAADRDVVVLLEDAVRAGNRARRTLGPSASAPRCGCTRTARTSSVLLLLLLLLMRPRPASRRTRRGGQPRRLLWRPPRRRRARARSTLERVRPRRG